LNPIKKLCFLLKKCTFDPHAAKAQNKKIWYLRDQQVVATTSQEDHQAEAQEATINPKDRHLLQKAKPLPTERKKHFPNQHPNLTKATGLVMTSLKAVLVAVHHRAKENHHQDQNLIQAVQQAKAVLMAARHRAIKNHFHHAANPTRAGQHLVMMTDQKEILVQALVRAKGNLIQAGHHRAKATDQKEVLAQALVPAKGNLTQADHHRAKATGQKEVLEAALPAKRNHTHLHAPEHHQILKTSQKEASVVNQPASVSLMQVQDQENGQQIKNLAAGQPKADLRNAKAVHLKISHIQAIGRNANQHTIK
jgi:hypothetical protein